MKNWYVRWSIRATVYVGGLVLILLATASNFDRTEWSAVVCFAAAFIFLEGALGAIAGRWPPRRRGRASTATVLSLAACIGLAAPLGMPRRVDEVRTVYLGPASLAVHELRCREARW